VQQIRILLADDHTIIRSGLRLLLDQQQDFKVVAEASNGREAVELAAKERPDVAVHRRSRLAACSRAPRVMNKINLQDLTVTY
jgi:DNA-binding NarL/FixJ family response regulator